MAAHRLTSRPAGFSLIELLVVTALSAVVLTASALAYRALTMNQKRVMSFQTVRLGSDSAVYSNYFQIDSATPATGTEVDSYVAPNYGRVVLADRIRNLFYEDVETGNHVICLPRAGLNSYRPGQIDISNGQQPGYLDTPAAFLAWLNANSATAGSGSAFISYRGNPPATVTVTSGSGTTTKPVVNGTVFVFMPSGSVAQLWVRAVYEIDHYGFTDSTGVPCVYSNVRRYVSGTLTHFYDCVYRDVTLADIGQPFVHFERHSRSQISETAVTPFKIAGSQPFYLIWWPDPGMSKLRGTSAAGRYSSSLVQSKYDIHEGQTDFSFVVPQYPML